MQYRRAEHRRGTAPSALCDGAGLRWNQPAGVNLNIANIPLPSAEERAEMRALDRKLDALVAKLKA